MISGQARTRDGFHKHLGRWGRKRKVIHTSSSICARHQSAPNEQTSPRTAVIGVYSRVCSMDTKLLGAAMDSVTETITWTTAVSSSEQVEYGTSTPLSHFSPLNTTLSTSHSITLTALLDGVIYRRPISKDVDQVQVIGVLAKCTTAPIVVTVTPPRSWFRESRNNSRRRSPVCPTRVLPGRPVRVRSAVLDSSPRRR